jgi:hypothetical protein
MPDPQEDYFSAGLRHLRDARVLAGASDNAAYLAGYVVECGLKRVIQFYDNARPHGHDLVGMQGRALALAALMAPGAARYRVDLIPDLEQACQDWSSDLRYRRTGDLDRAASGRLVAVADAFLQRLFLPLVLDGEETRLR